MSKKKEIKNLIDTSDDLLPSGWIQSKISDVLKIRNGFAFKSKDYTEKGTLLVRQTNLGGQRISLEKAKYLPETYLKEFSNYQIKKNDILIGMSGSIGKLCIYDRQEPALQNQRTGLLEFYDESLRLWLWYYLPTLESQLLKKSKGVAVQNISASQIESFPIPIAPKNEQSHIVAEIEKQFSRLDEAVENLKRVKANLRRYKASVLKAAVVGKLTEEWRKANPDVEPADKLLERILTERRKKWEEAELAKMKAKGKEPKNDKWKQKYKEPSQPDISTLDELPDGWHWLTSDQLFWFITSGSRGWAKYYSDSGAVFLRIGNLDHDSVALDLKKVQFVMPPRGAEGTRTRVEENDILISITADVGMIGVIPIGFEEAYINQHISLARPVSSVNSLYIAWYLASKLGQNQFSALKRGATKAGLGLDDIRSVNIPMPPFKEQEEIISQIGKSLSVFGGIGLEVDKNLKRADRLRQSILKKAFSGKLVPQDPNDEPASILIDKIKIELANKGISKVKTKRKKTPKRGKKVKSSKIKRKLMDILTEYPDGIRPELLLSEANYSIDEIDDFYAQLGKISDQIEQIKPAGKQALKWPFEAEVTLRLRSK